MFVVAIIAGLFGLLIGSFLNVLILRHGTGRDLSGRSGCFSCASRLRWYELIPVVSWILQRGRCRSCGSRISLQYPLVESVTGLGFALVSLSGLPPVLMGAGFVIISLLIAIAWYDILHTIIPDPWVFSFMGVAFVYGVIDFGVSPHAFVSVIAGGLTMSIPLWGLWALSKGRWMGFGDVKLALGMGFVVGTGGALTSLFLAFMLGAVVGVFILMLLPRLMRTVHMFLKMKRSEGALGYTMKSEVPFGPFLVLGFSIVWFMDIYGAALPLLLVGFR